MLAAAGQRVARPIDKGENQQLCRLDANSGS